MAYLWTSSKPAQTLRLTSACFCFEVTFFCVWLTFKFSKNFFLLKVLICQIGITKVFFKDNCANLLNFERCQIPPNRKGQILCNVEVGQTCRGPSGLDWQPAPQNDSSYIATSGWQVFPTIVTSNDVTAGNGISDNRNKQWCHCREWYFRQSYQAMISWQWRQSSSTSPMSKGHHKGRYISDNRKKLSHFTE